MRAEETGCADGTRQARGYWRNSKKVNVAEGPGGDVRGEMRVGYMGEP